MSSHSTARDIKHKPTLTDLPVELRESIAAYLCGADLIALADTCRHYRYPLVTQNTTSHLRINGLGDGKSNISTFKRPQTQTCGRLQHQDFHLHLDFDVLDRDDRLKKVFRQCGIAARDRGATSLSIELHADEKHVSEEFLEYNRDRITRLFEQNPQFYPSLTSSAAPSQRQHAARTLTPLYLTSDESSEFSDDPCPCHRRVHEPGASRSSLFR